MQRSIDVMRKIKVAAGIYYVEIPEIGLFIQCGCPADSVKHLMRKGLIISEEKNGVQCESGPNAILLSDTSMQNERLANLAEFPVLQMFYRQGLILPNHPNNTGLKPLLIGIEDQVKAQAEYIMRGNYGLISEEEILTSGVDANLARDLFRIKLRFAFDKLRKTEELLDMCVVGSDPVEIRDGARVNRLALNVYEFSYGGSSVTVDLNLKHGEDYEAPYQLGFNRIKSEYFSIIHSGEGDGWDVNRPCMASILNFHGKLYLIDAGPNLLHSLQSLGISVNEIEGIFHTHAHDDHFNGLPILMRADHRIKYFATPLVRHSVVKKLSALTQMKEEHFSRYFDVHDLKLSQWNDIDGLEVMPMLSPHPVETTIMFFRALWIEGYKTYAHFADIAAFDVLAKMITDDPSKSGLSKDYFESVKKLYHTQVDIKKLDIGGGMIHGNAQDFKDDPSGRIILSHSALPFTDSQKTIGGTTAFGVTEVLIHADKDYTKAIAHKSLHEFFPSAPNHEIHMLLNCPIAEFSPGEVVIKTGETNKNIYLLLSGVAEFIVPDKGVNNKLTSGAFLGELSGVLGADARGTCRALSYLKTISIPTYLYGMFLKRNNLYDMARRDIAKRRDLQNTWLFGERLSCPIMSRIAAHITTEEFKSGSMLPTEGKPSIFLINSGEVKLVSAGSPFTENIGPSNFFGEERVLHPIAQPLIKAHVMKDLQIDKISADLIDNIPIVMLKLNETLERRLRMFRTNFVFA
jgi:hemerythrin